MFQQNPYQQQGFGAQQQQSQGQQVYLQEQDLAQFVLSELKRTAREYTTAALEASNPQIRQTFQSLVHKTLQDQAEVFQEIQKLGGYEVQPAQQQQLQQELQKQSQSAAKLQSFVQQNLSKALNNAGSQQHQQHQFMAGQQQQQQHNQMLAQQQAFQPVHTIHADAYPNAVQTQHFSQNAQHQHSGYSSQQEHGFTHAQGYSAPDYGMSGSSGAAGKPSYSAGSATASGAGGTAGKGQQPTMSARSQTSGT